MKKNTYSRIWAQNAALIVLASAALLLVARLPAFHTAAGFLSADYVLLISATTAVLLFVIMWRTSLRPAAGWFALYLFGQGVTLQLIDAGPTIHYQHYRVINGIETSREAILLVLLALQAILVIAGIRTRHRPITAWIKTHLGMGRLTVVGVALVILSIFPSRELPLFAAELLISGLVLGVQFACLLLGMSVIPRHAATALESGLNHFLAGTPTNRTAPSWHGIDRLTILCAIWVMCIAAALAVLSYERHPHIQDEVAYIFQANYFADGRLTAPAPPVTEAVETYLIDCDTDRCLSPVPPGWPAILALGSAAGADWLVNPVLAGINVILLFTLLRQLYDRYTARLGVLLLAAAPWYLLMSMNFMTHTFSLTCTLLAALSVVQMHRSHNSLWGVPGGIAIGLLSLARPLEGLMVATVLGLAALFIAGQRFRLAPVMVLGCISLAVGMTVLPYNAALTGDPLSFPIMAYTDKVLGPGTNSLGFGPDKGVTWGGLDPFPGHGLPDVLVNAGLNLSAMNIEMFGWSIGSLLPVILLLLSPAVRRLQQPDRWMLFFIFTIFCFQSLYWFSGGPDFGARYYYLAVIPLTALTAQALIRLGQTLPSRPPSSPRLPVSLLAGLLVLSTGALTNFLPWRAIDKYHHYRGMRPDMRTLINAQGFADGLLLIKGESHPDLESAIIYSSRDPETTAPVIAWDRDADVRQRLLRAYPDKTVWLIDGPSRTGAGYQVMTGPVDPAALMR